MPIKSENKKLYPPGWRSITERIKARAGYCCEGSPAYLNCPAAYGEACPVTSSRVMLTCARLDHDPRNYVPVNLRAWCQRCHLTYDAPRKAADREARRRA